MTTFTSTFLALVFLVSATLAVPTQELSLKLPDECKGKGFCSIKPEGYDEMLNMVDKFLTPQFIKQNIAFGNRNGPQEEELFKDDLHNCPYRKKTEETMYAYSHSNDSRPEFIIQHKFLSQPIEIVTCASDYINHKNPDEECFQDLGLTSFNKKSSCQTLTYKRYFLAFDDETKKLVMKPFPVPCCCSCVIQHK